MKNSSKNYDCKYEDTIKSIEKKMEKIIRIEEQVDNIHKTLCGNGKEGLCQLVERNTRIRYITTGVGIAIGSGSVLTAILWILSKTI